MAYWNHFSKKKYADVPFENVKIGDRFRKDFFKDKRRRRDIICEKTGELSCIEVKSKREHIYHSAEFTVAHLTELFNHPNQ